MKIGFSADDFIRDLGNLKLNDMVVVLTKHGTYQLTLTGFISPNCKGRQYGMELIKDKESHDKNHDTKQL